MAWNLVGADNSWDGNGAGKTRCTYLLDAAADIESLPDENSKLSPGSIAYTADMRDIWQKNGQGEWVKVGD